MSEPPPFEPLSPASRRAQRMLAEALGPESEFRAGVVVLSYRRPGAGESDVSFGHACGLSAEHGVMDFILLAKALRRIADQVEGYIARPEEMLRKATLVEAKAKR